MGRLAKSERYINKTAKIIWRYLHDGEKGRSTEYGVEFINTKNERLSDFLQRIANKKLEKIRTDFAFYTDTLLTSVNITGLGWPKLDLSNQAQKKAKQRIDETIKKFSENNIIVKGKI